MMFSALPTYQRGAALSARHADLLRRSPAMPKAMQLCRARKGKKRDQDVMEEDVEIFNIETGWSVEALSSIGKNGLEGAVWESQADLDAEGWIVEADNSDGFLDADGSDEGEDAFDFDEEDDDDDGGDIWDLAGGAAAAAGGAAAAAAATRRQRREGGGSPDAATDKSVSRALGSIPRHVLRALERQQREAEEENAKLKPAERKKLVARQKTHQRLRIISGSAAGRRLLSPQGDQTRPMMEMVRGAVFNMLMSMCSCQGALPEGTRWLDLFAGTGAIGIEALSRGCGEAHFVELSPWVVSNCLLPNLEACEVEEAAVVHTARAEDFLQKARGGSGRFAGGAFDFISVCPPYMLVSYEELYELLEGSPLLHEESIVIVEYPKRLAHLIRPTLGPLSKLKDRRYGRTFIAVYGPSGEPDEAELA